MTGRLVAVTTAEHRVELVRRPVPEPAAGHVLVDVACVSLCGTDAHIWAGEYPPSVPPLVQGHEITGRIGEETVVIDPTSSCGTCLPCRAGRGNACRSMVVLGVHADGGLREVLAVPRDRVHPAPGLDDAVAVLVEPASIALRAVERSAAGPGTHVLVLGGGPIGLLATRALADRGARVAVVDRIGARAAAAARYGAELVQVAGDGFPAAGQRAELAGWAGPDGPAVVVEATGAPAALHAALDLVAGAGTVVSVGISAGHARLPMSLLPYKELDLLGSRNGVPFPQAVAFVVRHRDLLAGLVTHRFALERTQEAMALAHRGDPAVGKILVTVGRS